MKRLLTPFLDLPYWSGSAAQAVGHVKQEVSLRDTPLQIVTINAEMIIHALEHPSAAAAIVSSDFFVADTMSVTWWLRMHHKKVTRIPGIDLAQEFLNSKPRIAIIGGFIAHVRERAAEFIVSHGGTVVYSAEGPRITAFDVLELEPWLSEIRSARPDIILIAFNHGKQEWWGSALKQHLDFPVVIMGVGGTLDVWGGKIRRAPYFMRKIGLEWVWRLIQEPQRFKRIITATIIFPYRAIRDSLV